MQISASKVLPKEEKVKYCTLYHVTWSVPLVGIQERGIHTWKKVHQEVTRTRVNLIKKHSSFIIFETIQLKETLTQRLSKLLPGLYVVKSNVAASTSVELSLLLQRQTLIKLAICVHAKYQHKKKCQRLPLLHNIHD